MNILHINVAGIKDRFYDILFEHIRQVGNPNQDVYIAYKQGDYENNELLRLKEYHEDIKPILSPIKNNIDRLMYFSKIKKYFNDLETKTKVKEYEIIHAHSLFSDGGVAYKANKKYQIPYIVSIRITDIDIFLKYFVHLKPFMKVILTNASHIIFLSPSLKTSLLEKIESKMLISEIEAKSTVLPNAIDGFWLENIHNRSRDQKQSIKLIQVGKLTKGKNTKTTIYAVQELKSRGIDVALDVVGSGKEIKRLEKLVNRLGVESNVKFHGFIDSKWELLRLYRNADFFVLPSYFETFGIVYIEAMSQGLPVIYTKGQGIDGYFKDGEVGFSIDPFSSKEICEAIIKISKSYDEISKRCTKLTSSFNWIDITKEYCKFYETYKKGR